jgi:hypothetical protein
MLAWMPVEASAETGSIRISITRAQFVVGGGSVPEPGSAALALLGVAALLGRVADRFLGRAQ